MSKKKLVSLRYLGPDGALTDSRFTQARFVRNGEPVAVPAEDAERLLALPGQQLEVVDEPGEQPETFIEPDEGEEEPMDARPTEEVND